jgi:hypothetical protein
MNRVFSKIFVEAISSIIVGGVPCVLIVYYQGVDALFKYVHSLAPPNIVTYYFAGLTIAHILIWAIGKYVLQTEETSKKVLNKLHIITYNVGFTLTGFYRVLTGAMLIYLAPILYVEPSSSNLPIVSIGYYTAIAFLLMCCVLSAIQEETKVRVRNS